MPSATVPDRTPPTRATAAASARARWRTTAGDVEGSDGLVVLCAEDDTHAAWLRAGEGLSALWLHAVREGLSVVPLSQVVEVAETRAALAARASSAGWPCPLLLVRVGWQAISRSQLEPTPRRPLDAVLLPLNRLARRDQWPGQR